MQPEQKELTSEEKYRFDMINYKNQYSLEKWYDSIKDYTFKSLFYTLTQDEANSFVNYYKAHQAKQEVPKSDLIILSVLEAKLDHLILAHFSSQGQPGAFVKLSTRSAKDCVMEGNKLENTLKEEIKTVPCGDSNGEMIAYINSMIKAMMISSGEEIIHTFGKSERVSVDIQRWLEFSDRLDPLLITLREFDFNLRAHMEFRCFVFKKNLTAISQYYDTPCFADLVSKKDWYRKTIEDYLPKILSLLELTDFIIDLIVFDDGSVKVIELNPWATTTGGSLFSWVEDREILKNGPLQIRVVEKVDENVVSTLFPELRDLINRVSQQTQSERPSGGSPCVIS